MRRLLKYAFVLVIPVVATLIYVNLKQPIPCANSVSCIKNLNVDIENGATGVFDGQKITPPKIDLSADNSAPNVLGDSTATGEKHIYVDLTTQTLTAYQGGNLFMQTL